MKFRRPRIEQKPSSNLKPKRLDLNEEQLTLQRAIAELSLEQVLFLDLMVHSALEKPSLEIRGVSAGLRFYSPDDVAKATGLSKQTVVKFTCGYLRLVKRGDESAEDFRKRFLLADRPDAPGGFFQLISSRVLLFCLLAPTQMRGEKLALKSIREFLASSKILAPSSPRRIHANSVVTTWETSKVSPQTPRT